MPPAPPRPSINRPTVNGNGDSLASKTARIDLDGDGVDDEVTEGNWELRENYVDAPDGDLNWVVRAKEEDLDKAVAVLEAALEKAKAATHGQSCLRGLSELMIAVGLLTGLPRSAFPRIIGSK